MLGTRVGMILANPRLPVATDATPRTIRAMSETTPAEDLTCYAVWETGELVDVYMHEAAAERDRQERISEASPYITNPERHVRVLPLVVRARWPPRGEWHGPIKREEHEQNEALRQILGLASDSPTVRKECKRR